MEFKYMDKVRVTKGFYEGLVGFVTNRKCIPRAQYYVEMYRIAYGFAKEPHEWIFEEDLEKIEGDK